jgi:hypothetical protein
MDADESRFRGILPPYSPPREPQATEARCLCRCHSVEVADFRAVIPWTERIHPTSEDKATALRSDPLSAASACPRCLHLHCPALLTPKPEPKPREPYPDDEDD